MNSGLLVTEAVVIFPLDYQHMPMLLSLFAWFLCAMRVAYINHASVVVSMSSAITVYSRNLSIVSSQHFCLNMISVLYLSGLYLSRRTL